MKTHLMKTLGFCGLLATALATNAAVTFTKIADNTTLIPGGTGSFDSLSVTAQKNGTVLFTGSKGSFGVPGSQYGAYRWRQGMLEKIADRNTVVPGTAETFFFVAPRDLDGQFCYLTGSASSGFQGLFAWDGTNLTTLLNTSSTAPGTGATFTGFTSARADHGRVIVAATTSDGRRGLYLLYHGAVTTVADTATPVPSGSGYFQNFDGSVNPPIAVENDTVAFMGTWNSSKARGVYRFANGALTRIADTTQQFPGTNVTLSLPYVFLELRGDAIVFPAESYVGNGYSAYLRWTPNGGLTTLFDSDSLGPDGLKQGSVGGLFSYSYDLLTYIYQNSGTHGTRSWQNGQITSVLLSADTLDGKTVLGMNFYYGHLNSGLLALDVRFNDSSFGIYLLPVLPPIQLHTVRLDAAHTRLSWNGWLGTGLQQRTALPLSNWQDVPGTDGASTIDITDTNSAAFFRTLRR